jgi:CRP/FNR family transcriptional regulator, nitrogen oxide reductase regulator
LTAARRRSEIARKTAPPDIPAVPAALFQGLGEDEVRALRDRAVFADYAPRTWLYRQGEPARQLFLVESGLVRLSQLTPEGDDVLVRFVKPGEVFGYFSVATGGINVVSAQVVQPGRLAVWEREAALEFLHSIPSAAVNLFNIAVRDVVYFYERTRRLLTQPVGRRVEWALSELVRTIGVRSRAGVVITHGIAQRELAELAGTTIFTVSRELTKLERQGILQKQRGRIVVLQPENLSDW